MNSIPAWCCATALTLACGIAQAQFGLDKLLDGASKAAKTLTPSNEDEERRIGTEWAAMLVGAAPLLKNDALQRYVNEVGRWVAQQSERPELAWRFGVLDSDNVNAFATPGGYVFVTRGLLARLGSEAELAGVLGHEIAHVVRKHHLNAVRKQSGIGLGADLIADFGLSRTEHADISGKLLSGAREVMLRGLDKSDEYEADRMGVALAARAGYDPYGLPLVLQNLQALDARDGSLALMFQTHPQPDARLSALSKAMGTRFDAHAGQPALDQRFSTQLRGP